MHIYINVKLDWKIRKYNIWSSKNLSFLSLCYFIDLRLNVALLNVWSIICTEKYGTNA